MLRTYLIRAALAATPFVVWFAWSAWARRSGRQMGATPWAWLAAAAGALFGLSLMASALFHTDNRNDRYIPGEVGPDGRVSAGRFEKP
ncbi:MAG: hypothetical protein JF588_15830 [Caulobacterales bacterium]|nr:hypothetical protein [Caulobacterales bacterium]